jgi:hypothetical protein
MATNAAQNMPFEVVLVGTPTGAPDGGVMLNWTLNLNGVGVSAGSQRMLPGDPIVPLLYSMRGSIMAALKPLRLQDILVAGGAGAAFQVAFGGDLLALLPNNPYASGMF